MVLRTPHMPTLLHERPITPRTHSNRITESLRSPRLRLALFVELARLGVLGLVLVFFEKVLDLHADLRTGVVDGDGAVAFAGESEVEEGPFLGRSGGRLFGGDVGRAGG